MDDGAHLERSGAGYLDTLSEEDARSELLRCCGSERWCTRMLERRPFGTDPVLFGAADEIWLSLGPTDWLEAFSHHPRIGERSSEEAEHLATREWSAKEQSGMDDAPDDLSRTMEKLNQDYQDRYGHVFLICATGRTGPEMLEALRQRLLNDPMTELRVAAGEQSKITRLRLEKLGKP